MWNGMNAGPESSSNARLMRPIHALERYYAQDDSGKPTFRGLTWWRLLVNGRQLGLGQPSSRAAAASWLRQNCLSGPCVHGQIVLL
jgi:hypothetical protein